MAALILFGEDDEDQSRLIAIACRQAGLAPGSYVICRNGLELIGRLERCEQSGDVPTRIVTDLRMPLMDGIAVAAWVRAHPKFKHIPVTIVTAHLDLAHRIKTAALPSTEILEKTEAFRNFGTAIRKWMEPSPPGKDEPRVSI